MTQPATKDGAATVYKVLGIVILCAVAVIGVLDRLEHRPKDPLPLEFRVIEDRLSELPVSIDDVISCSCWHGPRNQAQRKYKFHIVNHSGAIINIGGGTESQIRLIVAYPTREPQPLTFPVASDDDDEGQFEIPPDERLRIATEISRVRPSRLIGKNALFNVPSRYSVWALPPTPNKLAEIVEISDDGSRSGSFPTVVDKTQLLPDEGYRGTRFGHGTWTFYIPIDPKLASLFRGTFQIVRTDASFERDVIFVGVAVFARGGSSLAHLLGFAPAPSDAALLDPSDF